MDKHREISTSDLELECELQDTALHEFGHLAGFPIVPEPFGYGPGGPVYVTGNLAGEVCQNLRMVNQQEEA